jgi:hypothetical protein
MTRHKTANKSRDLPPFSLSAIHTTVKWYSSCGWGSHIALVNISYEGWKEIVISEVLELDNQMFFEDIVRLTLAQGLQIQPTVNWVDGIAFVAIPFQDTDVIVREKLKGTLHFASVMFTRMDFKETYAIRVGNNDLSARLRKPTNPLLLQLAAFLKDFKRPPK